MEITIFFILQLFSFLYIALVVDHFRKERKDLHKGYLEMFGNLDKHYEARCKKIVETLNLINEIQKLHSKEIDSIEDQLWPLGK